MLGFTGAFLQAAGRQKKISMHEHKKSQPDLITYESAPFTKL